MRRTLIITGLVLAVAVVVTPHVAEAQSTSLITLPNPIRCNTATCLISQVVRYILGVIALLATIMFIWGGVLMLTSGGNSERIRQAKETLAWAAIGVVVVMLSWAIIVTVLKALVNK